MSLETKIAAFKSELLKEELGVEEIFKKYVIDSPNYLFNELQKQGTLENQVKDEIANYYGISTHEVFIVGSSQLGFSLNPKNQFAVFDSKFSETGKKKDMSDIDVAIVSPVLFHRLGRKTFEFTNYYSRQWCSNEYYHKTIAESRFRVPLNYKFFEFYTKGWYRPDFKPSGFEYALPKIYEVFKGILYRKVKRKMAFGIYQDWYYFQKYHTETLKHLRKKIKTDVI